MFEWVVIKLIKRRGTTRGKLDVRSPANGLDDDEAGPAKVYKDLVVRLGHHLLMGVDHFLGD